MAGNESGTSADSCAETNPVVDIIPPSTPASLTVTDIFSNQINLSWTASTDNVGVAGYKVYRNGIPVKSVAGTSFSNIGLTVSTQYCYQISAYDMAGNESELSSQVCGTTPAIGGDPPPLVQWLTFLEGNPGIPGDEIFVSSANPPTGWFNLQPPFSLGSVNDGITVSVFGPGVAGNLFGVQVNVSPHDVNHPCAGHGIGLGAGSIIPSEVTNFNGVSGVAHSITRSKLQIAADTLHRYAECATVTINDLAIDSIVPHSMGEDSIITLDAVSIGLGLHNFP
jgi:hypothetical protein